MRTQSKILLFFLLAIILGGGIYYFRYASRPSADVVSPSGSELLSWGDNGQGQLGLGNRVQWWEETGEKYSPTKVGSDQN